MQIQSHLSHVVESLPSWSNAIKSSHTKLKVSMNLILIREVSMLKLKSLSYNENEVCIGEPPNLLATPMYFGLPPSLFFPICLFKFLWITYYKIIQIGDESTCPLGTFFFSCFFPLVNIHNGSHFNIFWKGDNPLLPSIVDHYAFD